MNLKVFKGEIPWLLRKSPLLEGGLIRFCQSWDCLGPMNADNDFGSYLVLTDLAGWLLEIPPGILERFQPEL